jgi:hypothetical protein
MVRVGKRSPENMNDPLLMRGIRLIEYAVGRGQIAVIPDLLAQPTNDFFVGLSRRVSLKCITKIRLSGYALASTN